MRCSGMGSVLLVLTLTVRIAGTTVAAERNDPEFKGFHFGRTTLQEWKRAVREQGEDLFGKKMEIAPYCDGIVPTIDAEIGIVTCSWYAPNTKTFEVGPAGARFNDWDFLDGVLADFIAFIQPSELPGLLDALKIKYGKPTSMLTPRVQNMFGAQFTNEIYVWKLGTMDITVTKYAGQIDSSRIYIANPQLSAEINKRRKQKSASTKGL